VPLNSELKLRHQFHIQRPSLGFRAVYVVTRLQKEYTRQAYLNKGLARWLRAE